MKSKHIMLALSVVSSVAAITSFSSVPADANSSVVNSCNGMSKQRIQLPQLPQLPQRPRPVKYGAPRPKVENKRVNRIRPMYGVAKPNPKKERNDSAQINLSDSIQPIVLPPDTVKQQ